MGAGQAFAQWAERKTAGWRGQWMTAAQLAVVSLGLVVQSHVAHAQNDTSFTLINRNSVAINRLYVSAEKQSKWGGDLLGAVVLGAAQRVKIEAPRDQGCIFDVRVQYANRRLEERFKLDLCRVSTITFDGSASRAEPAPDQKSPSTKTAPTATPNPDFLVVNRSQKVMGQLFVSSADSTSWGADLLPGVLKPGDRFEVKLPRNGQCVYDIRVIYADAAVEDRTKQNVCTIQEMVFAGPGQAGPSTAPAGERIAGYGTGFFVSAAGHALTNHHVVDGCSRVATVIEGQMLPSHVVRVDKQNDLALVRAQVPKTVLFATFRAAPGIRVGEEVVAAGFPFPQVLQNGLNVTRGNVSAMGGIGGNTAEMQMTAPIQPGNSGGPLFDMSGHVVGVVVSRLNEVAMKTATQNVNYSVQGSVDRLFLESNGVRASEAQSLRDIKIGDLSDAAREYTYQIVCYKKQ